jgi:hypothetical protein
MRLVQARIGLVSQAWSGCRDEAWLGCVWMAGVWHGIAGRAWNAIEPTGEHWRVQSRFGMEKQAWNGSAAHGTTCLGRTGGDEVGFGRLGSHVMCGFTRRT